jgi:hypothetical protein
MNVASDAEPPRFVIGGLRADDTNAIDQAAALLVDAFSSLAAHDRDGAGRGR